MIEIGDPIEVRHGLGTKRYPFCWWAVCAGRLNKGEADCLSLLFLTMRLIILRTFRCVA